MTMYLRCAYLKLIHFSATTESVLTGLSPTLFSFDLELPDFFAFFLAAILFSCRWVVFFVPGRSKGRAKLHPPGGAVNDGPLASISVQIVGHTQTSRNDFRSLYLSVG